MVFDQTIPPATPVLVAKPLNELEEKELEGLIEFMKNKGKVIFLAGTSASLGENEPGTLFQARLHPVRGLWTCIPHLVRKHPIFEGLPSDQMMQNTYENVWATECLARYSDARRWDI